jgi:hypothetical protein
VPANIVVKMVSCRMDEMKDDASHGIFSMIIWEHLEPIRKFEKTTRHFIFIWNRYNST